MKFALVVILWGAPPERPAPTGDPWFGRDKALHFAASAAIQAASHAALRARGADYGAASAGAAAVTLTVGVSKELWDRHRGRDFSVRDLTWDAIGGTASAVTIRQIDR